MLIAINPINTAHDGVPSHVMVHTIDHIIDFLFFIPAAPQGEGSEVRVSLTGGDGSCRSGLHYIASMARIHALQSR